MNELLNDLEFIFKVAWKGVSMPFVWGWEAFQALDQATTSKAKQVSQKAKTTAKRVAKEVIPLGTHKPLYDKFEPKKPDKGYKVEHKGTDKRVPENPKTQDSPKPKEQSIAERILGQAQRREEEQARQKGKAHVENIRRQWSRATQLERELNSGKLSPKEWDKKKAEMDKAIANTGQSMDELKRLGDNSNLYEAFKAAGQAHRFPEHLRPKEETKPAEPPGLADAMKSIKDSNEINSEINEVKSDIDETKKALSEGKISPEKAQEKIKGYQDEIAQIRQTGRYRELADMIQQGPQGEPGTAQFQKKINDKLAELKSNGASDDDLAELKAAFNDKLDEVAGKHGMYWDAERQKYFLGNRPPEDTVESLLTDMAKVSALVKQPEPTNPERALAKSIEITNRLKELRDRVADFVHHPDTSASDLKKINQGLGVLTTNVNHRQAKSKYQIKSQILPDGRIKVISPQAKKGWYARRLPGRK